MVITFTTESTLLKSGVKLSAALITKNKKVLNQQTTNL